MKVADQELVDATIVRETVGDNWPTAIVMLIEAHETKHRDMVNRQGIHVLLDRYVKRYFPDVTVEYDHKRFVIRLLSDRRTLRIDRHLTALLRSAIRG